jgi:hypothetical protein
MNRPIASFLDRLVDRFTAILAGAISSRVEGFQAIAQAEQQSQLEDLARNYEVEGKTTIAQSLRERAARMTSTNLAGEAVEMIEAVTAEPLKLTGSSSAPVVGHLEGLPDFSAPPKQRKKPRAASNDPTGQDTTGGVS